ncbi:hypothetical protein VOLCADRAFT_116421, partial [Volvox carteri f. nagariensis]
SAHSGAPPPGSPPVPGQAAPRPRLLALHGWRTSGVVLAQQAARGPPLTDVQRAFQPPFFEWWDAVQDKSGAVLRYEGVEATLALLVSELQRCSAAGRPVVGLVGFSQGAMLGGLVAALQERGEGGLRDIPPLRCVVLIGGGVVRDPAFAHLCHLIGRLDPLQPNGEQLVGMFKQPLVLFHDQGHVVPRLSADQLCQLGGFLRTHLLGSDLDPDASPGAVFPPCLMMGILRLRMLQTVLLAGMTLVLLLLTCC